MPVKDLKDMTSEELVAERKKFQDKIDGPENDGRVTAGGSHSLDYWMDMTEEIDNELLSRAAGGRP